MNALKLFYFTVKNGRSCNIKIQSYRFWKMWDDFGIIEEHYVLIVCVLVLLFIGFILTDCGLQTCNFIDLGCVHVFQDETKDSRKQKQLATGKTKPTIYPTIRNSGGLKGTLIHASKDFPKKKAVVPKPSDHCVIAVDDDTNRTSLYPDLNQNFLVAPPAEIDLLPPRTGPSKIFNLSREKIDQQPAYNPFYKTLDQMQEERLNFLEMILLPSSPCTMYSRNWRNLFFNPTNPFLNPMMMNRWTRNQNYSPNTLEYPSVFSSVPSAWTSPFTSKTSAWDSRLVPSDTICYM